MTVTCKKKVILQDYFGTPMWLQFLQVRETITASKMSCENPKQDWNGDKIKFNYNHDNIIQVTVTYCRIL